MVKRHPRFRPPCSVRSKPSARKYLLSKGCAFPRTPRNCTRRCDRQTGLPATKRIKKLQRRNIMTKVNKWTLGLAAVGLVSLPAVVQAEEKPNQLLTALSSTMISGYVVTSVHWNLGSGNGFPPPYAYNGSSKQDGFNLNVVDITLEKPLDEGTWSAGYKVELWFGPNAAVIGNNVGGSTPST